MILDQIKQQESNRWFLDEELYDRLVYRTHFVGDPFAAIEFVLKDRSGNKAIVLFKGEDNKAGMELFFQKEIRVGKYLSLADEMSEMVFDYII
ncbi:hypothetical protein [Aquirufa nivalisilvae]